MECLRCGNRDPDYFYKGHKGYYCRKCIRYSRVLLEEEPETFSYEIGNDVSEYSFSYRLTSKQLEASKNCLDSLKKNDVLLHAVCGAGKTEITIESISYYLSKRMKVAYAIPRKEVVIELEKRFRKIFPKSEIVTTENSRLSPSLNFCSPLIRRDWAVIFFI